MSDMKNVENVLFRYNEQTGKWDCFSRDDYNDYWNRRSLVYVGRGYSPEQALKVYRNMKANGIEPWIQGLDPNEKRTY
jgi:pentatricopeptide repeat protein|tara:strand:+ start:3218 stop:3451 length:234 start_codon:yes stop_codon:yes gene_type:complete